MGTPGNRDDTIDIHAGEHAYYMRGSLLPLLFEYRRRFLFSVHFQSNSSPIQEQPFPELIYIHLESKYL